MNLNRFVRVTCLVKMGAKGAPIGTTIVVESGNCNNLGCYNLIVNSSQAGREFIVCRKFSVESVICSPPIFDCPLQYVHQELVSQSPRDFNLQTLPVFA